jgi:uncharacterized FlgJ-related protein
MIKSYLSRDEVNFLKTKEFGVLVVLLILIGTNITYLKYSDEKVVASGYVVCENKAESMDSTKIVYDNMTLDELAEKLDKSLNSDVKGQGYIFAKYSIETGVDPYLAVAVMLQETGCKWNCSYLASKCNNYGGQKGAPGCNGGSYKKFDTQEEGIKSYITNLYDNYISKGLTTPEQINKRYASDPNWSKKINRYINEIKSK